VRTCSSSRRASWSTSCGAWRSGSAAPPRCGAGGGVGGRSRGPGRWDRPMPAWFPFGNRVELVQPVA